jgi:hypothetical protein
MMGPFTHITPPGWQPADRSIPLQDNRRTPVHYRGKKVAGLFQRQRSTGLVYEARVRVNGEVRRETFAQAKTTAEAVLALSGLDLPDNPSRDDLERISRWAGVPLGKLVALSRDVDPFLTGTPTHVADATEFARLKSPA